MAEIDNETEQFQDDHENDNEFDNEAQLLESGEVEGDNGVADDSTADDPVCLRAFLGFIIIAE